MATSSFKHLGGLRDVKRFQAYLTANRIDLPCDETLLHGPESPLGQELHREKCARQSFCDPTNGRLGRHNGWTANGVNVSTLATFWIEWRKINLGGEAVAVCHAGRANPNQLANKQTFAD